MATIGERLRPGGGGLSTAQMIALAGALIGGAVVGWYGFQTAFGSGSTAAVPLAAQAVTIRPTTITQTGTTSGSIKSQQTSNLSFQTAGRVQTLNVKAGQTVQAGQVIATLDTSQLQIAVDTAQSKLTQAQAALQSFLNQATPDVLAADQQAVAQAQDQAATAQNAVQQAQTNKTTAANAVTSDAADIASAQYAAAQAADSAANADTSVLSAQNSYNQLTAGATPQDVAIAQASVNQAQTALNVAQENYDRLVNHTDIATRPETTALVTASAAYQQALANLANAEPQPANPYDVANAQIAVNNAAAQLSAAQQAAQLAQQNLTNAQTGTTTPPSPGLSCVALGTPGSGVTNGTCAPAGGGSTTTPPSQDQINTAQSAADQAATAVITASNAYQTALNNLQKLVTPISTQNLAGLQAAVDSARQQLDIARRNFDAYLNLTNLDTSPEATALNSAQGAYNTAVANYNKTVAPPTDTQLAAAQYQIQTAQTSADAARQAAGSAQTNITKAQVAYDNAVASTASSDSAITAAQYGVQAAQAGITAAQAKLQQDQAGPRASDIAQQQENVTQAQLALQTAEQNLQDATLTAPFSGVITAVSVNPGDQVATSTAIATLVDASHVELDAQVDESTYGQIAVGMPVRISMDALPNTPLQGFITQIIPSGTVTQGVVLFPIVITVTTPNVVLPNQASASQIQIILAAHTNVVAVRSNYIYRLNGQQVVDVLKNGKRVPTSVTTGLSDGTNTEITSGLQVGDQVLPPVKGSASGASGNRPFGASNPLAGGGGGGGGGGPVVVGP